MFRYRQYAGCVALWLCAPVAWAYISYYNPGEPIQVPVEFGGSGMGLLLDLDFNGVDEIRLTSNGSDFRGTPLENNQIIGLPATPPNMGAFIIPLEYGASIDATPDSPGEWVDGTLPSTFASCQTVGDSVLCLGLWLTEETSDAYFGMQFDIEGETHYGWVHLVNTFGITGYITEWAYETTPDTGLLAGVVPEPATSLLFVAGLLILHFKNKKRRFR